MEELKHDISSTAEVPSRPPSKAVLALLPSLRQHYAIFATALRRTVFSVIDHDCLNLAQSTAYSAILALFPALIVAAAVVGLLPDTAPVRYQMAIFFDRVLPPGVSQLLYTSFETSPNHTHSVRALVTAGIVSFLGASNVISTLMEGLRRAREFPATAWSFWRRRRRAFELVPLSLVPLAVASILVAFGHAFTVWIASAFTPGIRESIYNVTLVVRWSVALSASVGLIATIYHLGVPDGHLADPVGWVTEKSLPFHRLSKRREHSLDTRIGPDVRSWKTVLPGAVLATALWFLTTLAFGWYVTRFANYSEVYGSLGAGIALLFWLYIVSLCVLCGAEFNAQFEHQLQLQLEAVEVPRAASFAQQDEAHCRASNTDPSEPMR